MNISRTIVPYAQFSFVRMCSTFKSPGIINRETPRTERKNENISQQKARLVYQSRKRGMLENGLLLSTFADKYLDSLTSECTDQYDRLINEPSNDWDIYYWLTGKNAPPQEFDNEVFNMLKEHTRNRLHEQRFRQPDLRFSS